MITLLEWSDEGLAITPWVWVPILVMVGLVILFEAVDP